MMQKQSFTVEDKLYLIPESQNFQNYLGRVHIKKQKYIFCDKNPFFKLMLILCILGRQGKDELQQVMNQLPKIQLQKDQIQKKDKIIEELIPLDIDNPFASFSQNAQKIKNNIEFLEKAYSQKIKVPHAAKIQQILSTPDKIQNLEIQELDNFSQKKLVGGQKQTNLIYIVQTDNNFIFAFLELDNEKISSVISGKSSLLVEDQKQQEGNFFIIFLILLIIALVFQNREPSFLDDTIKENFSQVNIFSDLIKFGEY